MPCPEFNLLDEPWVKVREKGCSVTEVSLRDVLVNAHHYADLAGETAAQDVALLRLLLAVLHTVFSRMKANGEKAPITSRSEALRRWTELWQLEHFPEDILSNYLEEHRERFWLFHDASPFWQATGASIGTEFSAAKLNGEISESENKKRLFSIRSGNNKKGLSYAEATRWLVYTNAFADSAGKPKQKNLPSPGVAWLGRLGVISTFGKNLFETLMLNLTLLKDGEELWEEENQPIWESAPRNEERKEIPLPQNAAELLTLQSRRLLLQREAGMITGFTLLGGDFFPKEAAFSEQMTTWARVPGKGTKADVYQPKRHQPSRQMWRDFGSIFCEGEGVRLPGIVSWYQQVYRYLKNGRSRMASFRIASVMYDPEQPSAITDTFSDSIEFHSELLQELGVVWQKKIQEEIGRCEDCSYAVGRLAADLDKAAGGLGGKAVSTQASEQLYDRLDQSFRRWLSSIEPTMEGEARSKKLENWTDTARKIVLRLGNELVAAAGRSAFVGREVKEKIKGKEQTNYYSSPKAFEDFGRRVAAIYPRKEEKL